jgi:tRNA1(Val) A37 N6-methylase TrmN6
MYAFLITCNPPYYSILLVSGFGGLSQPVARYKKKLQMGNVEM